MPRSATGVGRPRSLGAGRNLGAAQLETPPYSLLNTNSRWFLTSGMA